ncbi:MAG: hypothetical protein ABIP79_09490 [Chitinophagaceae bacterium]
MGGDNRMVLGLDRPGGTEGVTLSILEDGTAGLGMFNLFKGLFAGNAPSGSFVTGLDKNFLGLIVRDSTGIKHNLGVQEYATVNKPVAVVSTLYKEVVYLQSLPAEEIWSSGEFFNTIVVL